MKNKSFEVLNEDWWPDLQKDPEVLRDWLHINLNVILALWPAPEAPGIHDLLEMH